MLRKLRLRWGRVGNDDRITAVSWWRFTVGFIILSTVRLLVETGSGRHSCEVAISSMDPCMGVVRRNVKVKAGQRRNAASKARLLQTKNSERV